jgi:Amt family ammonium transporter
VVAGFQGALAERTKLKAYLIVSAILAGFIYPIILAWTWGQGWLYDKGFHDFAGSGVVHLVAGTVALWGAIIVGERRAKIRAREGQINTPHVDINSHEVQQELDDLNADFSKIAKKHFRGNEGELAYNNNTFIVLGALLIWSSYIFFVGGRTLGQSDVRSSSSGKIIQNMIIASSFSALVSAIVKPIAMGTKSKYDVLTVCNGALVGMVSISAVADTVENWGSVLIGVIAALVYVLAALMLDFYHIDDPTESVPVHFAGGIWGLFAAGFLDNFHGALFDGAFHQGQFMGFQLVGITVIACFVSLITIPTFLILSNIEVLRADKVIEEIGFDIAELQPGVSEDFIEAVRERIEAKEAQERKRLAALGDNESKAKVSLD